MKNYAPFLMPDGEGGGAGEPAKDEGNETNDGAKSFDDILKENGSYQSELDRRINKAVETATNKERERQKIIQDKMQDEVLRVSRMTEDEKSAYFKTKAEKEQAKKEADLVRRELTLDARTELADRKMPDGFVDLLNYTDRDSCMKSIDTLQQAFQKAVQEAVNEKLKGSAPPKDAQSEGSPTQTDQEKALADMRRMIGLKTK